MDPIRPLDGLVELLRKQIASEVAAKGGARKSHKTFAERQQPTQQLSTDALKQKIAHAVDMIGPDDAKRKQKIVRVFVENTLSWKFGSELANNPGFVTLIDDVSEALDSEAELIEQLVTIG